MFCLFHVVCWNQHANSTDCLHQISVVVFCAWLQLHGSWKNSQHPLEKCKCNNSLCERLSSRYFPLLWSVFVFLNPDCRTMYQELKESSWTHQMRLQNGEMRGASQYSQIDCWNCGNWCLLPISIVNNCFCSTRALICLSRNYPTLQNIEKKKKVMELREETGAVLETAQFG